MHKYLSAVAADQPARDCCSRQVCFSGVEVILPGYNASSARTDVSCRDRGNTCAFPVPKSWTVCSDIVLGRVNTNYGIGDWREVNEENENNIQFIESGKDSTQALQPTKQPLYLVALLVHFLVVFPRFQPIAFGRHDRKHLKRQNQLARFIPCLGFIHNDMRPFPSAVFKGIQQFSSLRRITHLTRGEREGHGCFCVGCNQMNFRCPSCS